MGTTTYTTLPVSTVDLEKALTSVAVRKLKLNKLKAKKFIEFAANNPKAPAVKISKLVTADPDVYAAQRRYESARVRVAVLYYLINGTLPASLTPANESNISSANS